MPSPKKPSPTPKTTSTPSQPLQEEKINKAYTIEQASEGKYVCVILTYKGDKIIDRQIKQETYRGYALQDLLVTISSELLNG